MCGIVGFWNKENPAQESKLVAMRESLIHRGPDAGAHWIDGKLGLGHRRLSILDLSEGANQPYTSPCGNYTMVFNGEIFNYKSFYPELTNKGYQFRTTSDTEVLLYLLMEQGTSALKRLNGFFAFSFFDKRKQELLIARDRFGVKPLFYQDNQEGFFFASEIKALWAGGVPKQIEESHLDELFLYRFNSGENTVFKRIYRLLPGYFMRISNSAKTIHTQRWFHLGESIAAQPKIEKPYEWFEQAFHESIRLRMISDVPVGTLLSGGLDSSSTLFSQFKQGYEALSAWNISFSDKEHDESHLARKLSQEVGASFHSFEFTNEELVNLTTRSLLHHDEPIMHFSDGHLLGISEKAKAEVKVLLSGEGADEILGGYVRYKVHDNEFRYNLLNLIRYIPDKWLKNERLRKMKRYLGMGNRDAEILMNANELYLADLKKLGVLSSDLLPEYRVNKLEEAKQVYPTNRLRQLLYLEQHTHLYTLNDRNDRTTMGASIECRDPFLDPDLVVGVGSLPDEYFHIKGKGKDLLMNSIGKQLPDYITSHRKVGLSVPWDELILTNPYLRETLENLPNSELFSLKPYCFLDIKGIVEDFKKYPKIYYPIIRQVYFTALWFQTQFESKKVYA
ncbi:asparagine synthase (glutamine-hydrolysing) [Algoriphagus locisalis]|uniref:asparagine synthase (glutamine-hydrolyzing) n=1 Tax=Algoriphagus locisalis TaxID=305507 RepID=A0A1I6XRF3_9BACT|nr:asparagine synthase (glutamine-hydrolyzing) [Algoriphagus locisalis]SFT40511.1 asparagine synthase (glutamine-hydrolysing) [Algoriphagus locisalis]